MSEKLTTFKQKWLCVKWGPGECYLALSVKISSITIPSHNSPSNVFFFPPVVTDIVHSRCPQFQKECVLFITVMNLAINYPTSSFLSPYFPSIPFSLNKLIDFGLGNSWSSFSFSLYTLYNSNVKDGMGASYTCKHAAFNKWRKRQLFVMSSLLPNISHNKPHLLFLKKKGA